MESLEADKWKRIKKLVDFFEECAKLNGFSPSEVAQACPLILVSYAVFANIPVEVFKEMCDKMCLIYKQELEKKGAVDGG